MRFLQISPSILFTYPLWVHVRLVLMADMNKVGKRVKKYREHLGLTQEQLAVNSSLDLTFIKDVEAL